MKKINNKPTSFWNMKPIKTQTKSKVNSKPLFSLKLSKVKSRPLFSPKFIQPVNLKQYTTRTKSEQKLIDKNPFGDKDRDRVPNYFDCKPLDKKKQDFLVRVKPKKRIKKKYLPQVQKISDRLLREREQREIRKEELEKFKKNPETYFRKLKQLEKESQPENVGLYDFTSLPGIKIPENVIITKRIPVDLIVEKGIVKGELIRERRGKDTQEIKSLYILPEYRKKGLGKKVVTAVFKNPKIKKVVGVAAAESESYWKKLGGVSKGSKEEMEALKEHRRAVLKNAREDMYQEMMNRGELIDISELEDYETLSPELKKYVDSTGKSFEISREDVVETSSDQSGIEKPEALGSMIKRGNVPSKVVKEMGYVKGTIKEIDAAEFKKQFEKDQGEPLAWNEERLKSALKRNIDDDYPIIYKGKNKVDVTDGRHRIAAAAERNQYIDVIVEPLETSKVESSIVDIVETPSDQSPSQDIVEDSIEPTEPTEPTEPAPKPDESP